MNEKKNNTEKLNQTKITNKYTSKQTNTHSCHTAAVACCCRRHSVPFIHLFTHSNILESSPTSLLQRMGTSSQVMEQSVVFPSFFFLFLSFFPSFISICFFVVVVCCCCCCLLGKVQKYSAVIEF